MTKVKDKDKNDEKIKDKDTENNCMSTQSHLAEESINISQFDKKKRKVKYVISIFSNVHLSSAIAKHTLLHQI